MVMENQAIGICTTCNNSEICINVGDMANPKWYCEGFDCNGGSFLGSRDYDMNFYNLESINFKSSAPQYDTDKYKGLCLNCDNNETCKLLMPESGVWYCEEYK